MIDIKLKYKYFLYKWKIDVILDNKLWGKRYMYFINIYLVVVGL